MIKLTTAFRMWKSGKQCLNLNRKSVQAVKLDLPTEEKAYQFLYSDDEDGSTRRKLKNAGKTAAGLGFNVMGGELATDILEAALQKEVNNNVLVIKDSKGVELTDSTSATEEASISESI